MGGFCFRDTMGNLESLVHFYSITTAWFVKKKMYSLILNPSNDIFLVFLSPNPQEPGEKHHLDYSFIVRIFA